MSTLPRRRLIAVLSIALVVSVAGIAASQDGVDAPFSVSGAELATAEDLVRAIGNLSSNGELRPVDHGPPRQVQNYLPREAQHFLDQLKEIEQRSRPHNVPRTWLLGPEAPELLRTAYRLRAVLEDAGPIEHNRPSDLNRGAPFVSLDCPSGSTLVPGESRCADQTTARATLDLSSALSAHDPYAVRVCESRRWIAAHSDSSIFAEFSSAFAECGIALPNSL